MSLKVNGVFLAKQGGEGNQVYGDRVLDLSRIKESANLCLLKQDGIVLKARSLEELAEFCPEESVLADLRYLARAVYRLQKGSAAQFSRTGETPEISPDILANNLLVTNIYNKGKGFQILNSCLQREVWRFFAHNQDRIKHPEKVALYLTDPKVVRVGDRTCPPKLSADFKYQHQFLELPELPHYSPGQSLGRLIGIYRHEPHRVHTSPEQEEEFRKSAIFFSQLLGFEQSVLADTSEHFPLLKTKILFDDIKNLPVQPPINPGFDQSDSVYNIVLAPSVKGVPARGATSSEPLIYSIHIRQLTTRTDYACYVMQKPNLRDRLRKQVAGLTLPNAS